jgi:hypothetical protein
LYSYLQAYSPAPGTANKPSPIRPGFSFSAGITAEQKLGKKILLSLGLNYHYYSGYLQTGSKINPVIAGSTQATGYYAWGNSNRYTNQYHFLELPVSLMWKLGSAKKIPMFIEAGLTASEMLSAKALQYDYLSGIYIEAKNNFTKTQFMGNAAYLFGLKQSGMIMRAGPQVQYAFTNLAAGKEHLFFAGIKFIALLKK